MGSVSRGALTVYSKLMVAELTRLMGRWEIKAMCFGQVVAGAETWDKDVIPTACAKCVGVLS